MSNKKRSKSILEKKMEKATTFDWEKELCEALDKLLSQTDREKQLRQIETIVDDIEDLVFTAYYKGVKSGLDKVKHSKFPKAN